MEPKHGTNHVEGPTEELSTVIGESMDFENRLDEATSYEQNQSIGGAGSNVTDRNVFRTSNFDQIRPDLEPSIAPRNEDSTIHFDKSIETKLRSLFGIFLRRNVLNLEFDNFLNQKGLKLTNGFEEQLLWDILHEPRRYRDHVKQACLEFCLGRFLWRLQQKNLKISDVVTKTLHCQQKWDDFALACEHQEIQISQEYARKLWSEIFPEHQVTPKQQRANKRSHTTDEDDRRHDPASPTPPKQTNTNDVIISLISLVILDEDVKILVNKVENEVKLGFLIPCALHYQLKKDPEIFMAFTYSQRSDSQLIFWIETEDGNVITSVWNTEHNDRQNQSTNREAEKRICIYDCEGCASTKNKKPKITNTIRLTMLMKKITITQTSRTIKHDCGGCIPEVEENLQSKQTSEVGSKSQENILEILSQHRIVKIRTAINNEETVTSPDELKKVTAKEAARQRLLNELYDMLVKVDSLEGRCFPEGFTAKFAKHRLDCVEKIERAFKPLKLEVKENSIRTCIVTMFSQEQTLVNQDEQQVLLNESQAINGPSNACWNDQEMPGTSKQNHHK
uniref:Uncharacterized protein n=1 Tax=Acrobeloides nanus TaxID=290746 RepID=A0A914EMB8_9BILA